MYKKYTYNENYFNKIDSKDKAYFLGLLYADGNIYLGENAKKQRNRVQITLMDEDKYILQKFLDCLGSNSVMYSDRKVYTKLILDNKQLCNDLIKLGCTPNKCFTIKFPSLDIVSEEFLSHFIRGFFDGDGCVSINSKGYLMTNFTSNEEFINGLKEILDNLSINSSKFYKRYKNKKESSGSTMIGSKKSIKILYDYMYKDCGDLFLKRKRDKFKVIL